ncbi:MAG: RloB family protein [Saprospiraceae bacterium]
MASFTGSRASKKPNSFMAKRKPRQSPRILYLACEGTGTEYWYFKSLDETLDEEAGVRLSIYPDQADQEEIRQTGQKGVKTDPKSLCAKATEKLQNEEGINEAWIVIDKDRHPGLEATFSEAASTGVRIAFSSVSFEHWLLLHFEKNDTAFEKSDCKNDRDKYVKCGSHQPISQALNCEGQRCVGGRLRIKNHLPNFDKSNELLFHDTKSNQSLAYENAAWLRWRKFSEVEAMQGQICQVNPYTTMDLLLKSIYNDDQMVSWCAWGVPFIMFNLELTIQKTDDTYSIQAQNISDRSFVILPDHFYLTNECTEILPVELAFSNNRPNMLLLPEQKVEFKIVLSTIPTEAFYLNYAYSNHRLIFSE